MWDVNTSEVLAAYENAVYSVQVKEPEKLLHPPENLQVILERGKGYG